MSLEKLKDKIKEINDITEPFKTFFENIKGLCLLIFPVIGLTFAAFNFNDFKNFLIKNHILSEDIINFISKNSNGIISIILVILIIVLIFAIRKTGKRKIETGSSVYNIIRDLHNELVHKIRNATCELYIVKEKLESYHDNPDAINELQMHTFDNIINNLQNFTDVIAEYLSKLNNDTISVCIKVIDSGQENVANLDRTAKTLVRSKNTDRDRKRLNESIVIGKNTGFKHLCDGTNIWYHGVNLKKLYEDGKYEADVNIHDWQSKYNSTIVVPIRYFNTNKNGNPINDILGFLCIDSKKEVKYWDNVQSLELQYLAIYADSIYNYIKLFRKIFNER